MVYFHRFFAEASFTRHDYRVRHYIYCHAVVAHTSTSLSRSQFVAGAAVLLSLKLDEVPVRARFVAMELGECFGFRRLEETGDTANRLKASLLAYERILLSALQFDLTVQLPFGMIHSMSPKPSKGYAASSAGRLAMQRSAGIAKAKADAVRHGAQSMALMVMGSPIPLVYGPRAVAIASILASAALQGLDVVPSFEAEYERYKTLRSAAHEVLRAILTIATTAHVNPGKAPPVPPVSLAPLPQPPSAQQPPAAAATGGGGQ